jgi:pSer/pThr/pTyr-binding forkhead associated (FHA) protein
MIMLRKNTFFIRDLGAKNGTFVNGERLPKNRDIPVPIGSEVNITMNISMELWDAKTVVKLTDRRTSATHHSSVLTKTAQASDELELRSVFGIRFAGEDEGKVGDDYSPI